MKFLKKFIFIIVVLSIILFAGFLVYVNDYYHADSEMQLIIEQNSDRVEIDGDMTIFRPTVENDNHTAILFYPGGKVESSAYNSMLFDLSEVGFTVVLFEMPFNLAVFNINAASQAFKVLDGIESWYMMGHSLGGAMASEFAFKHQDQFDGLILLGAYPTKSLDIPVLTLYGENDLVINRDKLDLVSDRIVIPGGNHAFFGNYGEQSGDGIATITREQQQSFVLEKIVNFIEKGR